MSALLARAVRPRTRVVIIGLWLVAVFAVLLPSTCRASSRTRSATSRAPICPSDAESTRALEATKRAHRRRAGGDGDRATAARAGSRPRTGGRSPPNVVQPQRAVATPSSSAPRGRAFRLAAVSRDRTAALVTANITSDGESETIADPVKDARDIVGTGDGGLEIRVTGPAGFSADAIKVFEQINGSLIGAAFLLVFVLLIFIYRSPILLWFPLLTVAFAEITTRGIGWALDRGGGDGERPVLLDPVGPRARRGHRLRAADRGPLPRGAAQARGPHRGDDRGARGAPGPRSSPRAPP